MLTSTELSSSDESNKSACVEVSLVRSINSCSLEVCFCGASCRRSDLLLELPEASEESLFVLVPLSFWAAIASWPVFNEFVTRFTLFTIVSFLSAQFLHIMLIVNSVGVNCRPARISRSKQALFFSPTWADHSTPVIVVNHLFGARETNLFFLAQRNGNSRDSFGWSWPRATFSHHKQVVLRFDTR